MHPLHLFPVHPRADEHRDQLFEYGVGFHPLMDHLSFCAAAVGNPTLTEMFVVAPTASLAVMFLHHPYESKVIGFRYEQPAGLILDQGVRIPDPCRAVFFADVVDRWLEEELAKESSDKVQDREKARKAHVEAREFLIQECGAVPGPALADIRQKIEELRLTERGRTH